jgi:hypothetical protein
MLDTGMTVANRITGETGTMGASGSEMVGGRGEAFVSAHAKRKEEQAAYTQTVC